VVEEKEWKGCEMGKVVYFREVKDLFKIEILVIDSSSVVDFVRFSFKF